VENKSNNIFPCFETPSASFHYTFILKYNLQTKNVQVVCGPFNKFHNYIHPSSHQPTQLWSYISSLFLFTCWEIFHWMDIPVYLSILSLMDNWIFSSLGLLWIMLWTFMYKCLNTHMFTFLLGQYFLVELLGCYGEFIFKNSQTVSQSYCILITLNIESKLLTQLKISSFSTLYLPLFTCSI
jgi:hypothetical protein